MDKFETPRLSLADLAGAGVRLRPIEAATIVRELVLQVSRGELPGVPSAHVIRILPSGQLTIEGPVAAGGRTVSRAAQLLDTLLPRFDGSSDQRVPGGLRLAIARGLGMLDVPPFPSLESFAEALARFASSDPPQVLKDLAARSGGSAGSPAPFVTPAAAGAPAAAESQGPRPGVGTTEPDRFDIGGPARLLAQDEDPSTALVRSEPSSLTVSDIRRARRATGLPLSEVSSRSRIPASLLRQLEWGYVRNWPSGASGRTQLVRYARAAGLDEQVVVSTVLPLLEETARERTQAPVAFDESAAAAALPARDAAAEIVDVPLRLSGWDVDTVTSTKRKRTRVPAALAVAATLVLALLPVLYYGQQGDVAPPPQDIALESARPPSTAPAEPQAAPPVEQAAAEEIGERIAPERPTTSPPARSDAAQARRSGEETTSSAEARPAQGLTEEAAAYSPSFASVGSAMFYHAKDDSRSMLMRADIDAEGAILRITRVVDDNAQNFHARPSPDGTRIAFDSDRDGERGVYVADADGRNVQRVSGDGFAAVPSWSPDGRTLVFVRAEPNRPRVWNLWSLALDSGELRRLTSHRYGQPWGGSWFPDGRRIAYSHEDRLIVLHLESGRERAYPSPRKGGLVRTPAVSPNGRLVIFQVYRDGAWLLDLEDGTMRKVLADPSAEEYTWSPDGSRVAYHSRQSGGWGVWLMAAR